MQHSAMDTHDDDVYTPPLFSKGEAFGLLFVFEFICIGMVILLSLGFMLLTGHKINTPAEIIMVQEFALIFSVLFMTYRVQKRRKKIQTEETLASYLGLFGLDSIKWKFVLKWTAADPVSTICGRQHQPFERNRQTAHRTISRNWHSNVFYQHRYRCADCGGDLVSRDFVSRFAR